MGIEIIGIVLIILSLLVALGWFHQKFVNTKLMNESQLNLIKSFRETETSYKEMIVSFEELIKIKEELIETYESMNKSNESLIGVLRLKEEMYLESIENLREENEGLHNKVSTLTEIIRINEYR